MEQENSQQEGEQTEFTGHEKTQEENKDETTLQEPKEKEHILKSSKILDAYEYFLRQLAKNGLPQGNPYEFAAQSVEKYEKKIKGSDAKQKLDNLRKNRRQYSPIKRRDSGSKSPDITQIKSEQEETKPEVVTDVSQDKTQETKPEKGKGGKAAGGAKKKK